MKELIKQIEANEEFRVWAESKYHLARFTWLEMPTTAKLAIIQEWLREDKGVDINISYDAITYMVDLVHPTIRVKGNKDYWTKLPNGTLVEGTCLLSYNEALTEGIKEAIKLIEE